MHNVLTTAENNLCISCGICEGVCPQKCIKMTEDKGMYYPQMNEKCVSCGICWEVCPGKGKIRDRESIGSLTTDDLTGNYIATYNAWSKDEKIRHYGVSGGIVTTLIYNLLKAKEYDAAFVVDTSDYGIYVRTTCIDSNNADRLIDFSDERRLVPGSRYIPVGHRDGIEYIISNPTSRVIIVGTSCALRGYINVIDRYRLNRDNYLLIGLFCDSVMSYNVWKYFGQKVFSRNRRLSALLFRTKEREGWPGNCKLIFEDGSYKYLDRRRRIEVKNCFKPERCYYCIDKLNTLSDISVGDNYTKKDSSLDGSNSVIIRTQRGVAAWEKCQDDLEVSISDIEEIYESQGMSEKYVNQQNADFKEKMIYSETKMKIDINSKGRCSGREIDKMTFKTRMQFSNDVTHGLSNINTRVFCNRLKRQIRHMIKNF